MKPLLQATAFLLLGAGSALAQEAFVTQVSGLTVTTSTPGQIDAPVQQILQSATTLSTSVTRQTPTFRDDLLPTVTNGAAVARVTQTGNLNSAMIDQSGVHAALIRQTGTSNVATIQQTGGLGNRAAVIQASSRATGSVYQSGSNNRALIIQN